MMNKTLLIGAVLAATTPSAMLVRADSYAVPNSLAGSDNGVAPSSTTVPFSSGAVTTQIILGSTELSGIPAGSQITGISFRINAGNNPNTSQRDFANYDLTLSPRNSSVNFGSLSTGLFANNMDLDNDVVVRSGPLTIPANAFTSGASPNAFSYTLPFTTPYTYDGGDLVILMSHTGNTIGGGSGSAYTLDAFGSGYSGYGNVSGRSVFARFAAGYDSTSGSLDSPIAMMQFEFTAVPEPGSCAAVAALGMLGYAGWRRIRLKSA